MVSKTLGTKNVVLGKTGLEKQNLRKEDCSNLIRMKKANSQMSILH